MLFAANEEMRRLNKLGPTRYRPRHSLLPHSAKMVSRLTFKGDKKKPRKVVRRVTKAVPQESRLDIDPELIETSWTSATSFADIQGPLLLLQQSSESVDPLVVCCSPTGLLTVRSDLGFTETPLNFPPEGLTSKAYNELPIHRVEPTDVQQVTVAVSISHLIQNDKLSPNRMKLALKSGDKYLGRATGDDVECKSEAIGPAEMFELEKVVRNDAVWFRIWLGNNRLAVSGDRAVTVVSKDDEDAQDLFIVRVQAKSSTVGKRLLRENEESQSMKPDTTMTAVRNAIESLQKSNIEVTPATMKRLRDAALRGKINEQLVDERQRSRHDSRC